MADVDIIQQKILAQGQSQSERMPVALDTHFADVDEYSTADLLRFMVRLAPFINHFANDDAETPSGDWQSFFPFAATDVENWLANLDDATPPHLGLIRSFLTLYKEPQALVNQFTNKHLSFYYKDILRLTAKNAVPDTAHLLLTLKKNVEPIEINNTHVFSAGKDASGIELLYRPTTATIVNHAVVASVRTIYQDRRGNGSIHYAPIANSSDGLGGEIKTIEKKWDAFGSAELPQAETGFALSAPVLRMEKGVRKITVRLTVTQTSQLNNTALNQSLKVYLTGASQWIGPYTVSPSLSSGNLQFSITLDAGSEAIVNYDSLIHGYNYDARAPVIQCFLNRDNTQTGYQPYSSVLLANAKISVEVSGLTELTLQNELGNLDSKKAFMPFGPQPKKGSRLLIGHDEALSKKLSEVSLSFTWQDPPASFATHYDNYSLSVANNTFSVSVSFKDAGGWEYAEYNKKLFNSSNAMETHSLTFSGSSGSSSSTTSSSSSSSSSVGNSQIVQSLYYSNASWAQLSLYTFLLQQPVYATSSYTTGSKIAINNKSGFITLALEHDFLHQTYRKDYVKNALEFAKDWSETSITLINEPYTPVLQSLSLTYKAYSDNVKINANNISDYANNDVQFYHLGYFGQMREHAYQRHLFDYVTNKSIYLLPHYTSTGELVIGIQQLSAGDSVSLLFQVAEGSADPDLSQETIEWSVLCDNYWKKLTKEELISDSTNQLLTSGIIKFVIPAQATTTNTLLPTDHIWLRASVNGDVRALPQLIEIAANAVAVKFTDKGNELSHLASSIAPNRIAKLKTPVQQIKSVAQPYASFGGATAEPSEAFNTRTAERLRHKDRAITVWDYERLVLTGFPAIHKAKAIPHAKPGAWLSPGNVMLIVIPDLNNRNAVNPLQPKVDSNTISEIQNYLTRRNGMQTALHVRNPRYQQIQLSFRVKFHVGYEFNYYSQVLQSELIKNLSPWAYSDVADMQFGGKIYKSVLVDFIEELEFVDFITDVKLHSFIEATDNLIDSNSIQPQAPDIILASAENHIIYEYLSP